MRGIGQSNGCLKPEVLAKGMLRCRMTLDGGVISGRMSGRASASGRGLPACERSAESAAQFESFVSTLTGSTRGPLTGSNVQACSGNWHVRTLSPKRKICAIPNSFFLFGIGRDNADKLPTTLRRRRRQRHLVMDRNAVNTPHPPHLLVFSLYSHTHSPSSTIQ